MTFIEQPFHLVDNVSVEDLGCQDLDCGIARDEAGLLTRCRMMWRIARSRGFANGRQHDSRSHAASCWYVRHVAIDDESCPCPPEAVLAPKFRCNSNDYHDGRSTS